MNGNQERQRNALNTIIAMLVAMMAYWSRGRYIRDLPDYLDWDDIIRSPDESEFPPLERTGIKVGLGFGWRGFPGQSRLTGTWQACRDAIDAPFTLPQRGKDLRRSRRGGRRRVPASLHHPACRDIAIREHQLLSDLHALALRTSEKWDTS